MSGLLQRHAVLLHGTLADVAIALTRIRCLLERHSVLPAGTRSHLAVVLQLFSRLLQGQPTVVDSKVYQLLVTA